VNKLTICGEEDWQPGWHSWLGACYGLDGWGLESWWEQDFLYMFGLALRSIQSSVWWVLGLFPGGTAARAWCWPPTPVWHQCCCECIKPYHYLPFVPSCHAIARTFFFFVIRAWSICPRCTTAYRLIVRPLSPRDFKRSHFRCQALPRP